MEDESVHANVLIHCDAYLLYEPFLVPQGTKCGHEPAIAIAALADITSTGTIDIKLGVFKDIL